MNFFEIDCDELEFPNLIKVTVLPPKRVRKPPLVPIEVKFTKKLLSLFSDVVIDAILSNCDEYESYTEYDIYDRTEAYYNIYENIEMILEELDNYYDSYGKKLRETEINKLIKKYGRLRVLESMEEQIKPIIHKFFKNR